LLIHPHKVKMSIRQSQGQSNARVSKRKERAALLSAAGKESVTASGLPKPALLGAIIITPKTSLSISGSTPPPNYNNTTTSVSNFRCDKLAVENATTSSYNDVRFIDAVTFDPQATITGLGPIGGNGSLIKATLLGTVLDGVTPIAGNSPVTAPQLVMKTLGGLFTPTLVSTNTFSMDVSPSSTINVTSLNITGTSTFASNVTVGATLTTPLGTSLLSNMTIGSTLNFSSASRITGSNMFDLMSPATVRGQLLFGSGLGLPSSPFIALGPTQSDMDGQTALTSDLTQPSGVKFAPIGSSSGATLTSYIPTSIISNVGDLLISTGSGPNFWTNYSPAIPVSNQVLYVNPATGNLDFSSDLLLTRFPSVNSNAGAITTSDVDSTIFTQQGILVDGTMNVDTLRIGSTIRTNAGSGEITFNSTTIPPGENPPSISSAGQLTLPKGRDGYSQILSYTASSGQGPITAYAELSFITSQIVKCYLYVNNPSLLTSEGEYSVPFTDDILPELSPCLKGKGSIEVTTNGRRGYMNFASLTDGTTGLGALSTVIIPSSTSAGSRFLIEKIAGQWGDDPNPGPGLAAAQRLLLSQTFYWTVSSPMIPRFLSSATTEPPVLDSVTSSTSAVSGDGSWAMLVSYARPTPVTKYAPYIRIFQTDVSNTVRNQSVLNPSAVTPTSGEGTLGACAIDDAGKTFAVAQYDAEIGASAVSTVWIFTRSGTTWTEVQTIQVSTALAITNQFGISLSFGNLDGVSGKVLMIGFPSDSQDGRVYFYEHNGSSYVSNGIIVTDEQTGINVSVSSDGLRAVAVRQLNAGPAVGQISSLVVYQRTSGTWAQLGATITVPNTLAPLSSAEFTKVSMSEDGGVIAATASTGVVVILRYNYTTLDYEVSQIFTSPTALPGWANSVTITHDASLMVVGAGNVTNSYADCYRSQGCTFIRSHTLTSTFFLHTGDSATLSRQTGNCVGLSYRQLSGFPGTPDTPVIVLGKN
jgi:hypothetical protein